MGSGLKKILPRSISERIILRRKFLNIRTQEELAVLTGVSQEVISQIESGKHDNLKRITMEKLAKGLRVSLNFFRLGDVDG